MRMESSNLDRYRLLDASRGLAILWIVCFHVLVDVRDQYWSVLNQFIGYGYLGVYIFFVISGYGIASSSRRLLKGKSNPWSFLSRRFNRIYPSYWWHLLFAAIILPFLIALVSMFKSNEFLADFPKYTLSEWFQVITLTKVFSADGWDINLSFLPINGVIWYIAIIVQVYLFVAVCSIFKKSFHVLMFIAFILSLMVHFPIFKDSLPNGIFLPYFSQVYVGGVIYHLLRYDLRLKSEQMNWVILLLLISCMYFCSVYFVEILPLSFSVFVAWVFYIAYKHDHFISNMSVTKLLCFIGAFSYSIYLMHVPLWPFVDMFVRNFIPLSPEISGPVVLIPLLFALSYLWYLFFEKSSMQRKAIGLIYSSSAKTKSS